MDLRNAVNIIGAAAFWGLRHVNSLARKNRSAGAIYWNRRTKSKSIWITFAGPREGWWRTSGQKTYSESLHRRIQGSCARSRRLLAYVGELANQPVKQWRVPVPSVSLVCTRCTPLACFVSTTFACQTWWKSCAANEGASSQEVPVMHPTNDTQRCTRERRHVCFAENWKTCTKNPTTAKKELLLSLAYIAVTL